MLLSAALFMIMFLLKDKTINLAHRARDHLFFVRANDADLNQASIPGNHARIRHVFIHSNLGTYSLASHRRAWTETFVDSARSKSRTSFHRGRRGERSPRPRSFRRWGLWSRALTRSWSCSFLGCCGHGLLIPLFTLFGVSQSFLVPLLSTW